MSEDLNQRKLDHLRIVLEQPVEPAPSPFERYRLPYRALPELDAARIDTSTQFLGKRLSFPFLISSMTGGPDKAAHINRHLAIAAETEGVALGLGSMRVILRKPEARQSFDIRRYCPSIPLFANLGLVQVNYGVDADDINHLIDTIQADGIFLHVNPLQEIVQPEGDTNFADLLRKLEQILPHIQGKVIVKEVGNGIDAITAQRLRTIGVDIIDVAGVGGTSWSQVEGHRRDDRLGDLYAAVGVPTDQALREARHIDDLTLIGSGGVRSGLDVAKCIMLGASLAGAAKPFLEPALESEEAVIAKLRQWREEYRTALFAVGAADQAELARINLIGDSF